MGTKIAWFGTITSAQPRIRLMRSFDQQHHSYLGYVLVLDGTIGGEARPFSVAIGKAAHAKHQFEVGSRLEGEGEPVADPRLETAELYKVSKLKILAPAPPDTPSPPPWLGVALEPPDVPRARPQAPGRAHVRRQVHGLHLGLPDAGRDDHRSVEAEREEVPVRDRLLRPEVVRVLSAWQAACGAGTTGHVVGRGGLDRRGGHGASGG